MTAIPVSTHNRWLLGVAVAVGLFLITEPLLMLGREPARWLWQSGPADWADRPWIYVALAIIFQALLGLAAIAAMRRFLPQADAHLRLPKNSEHSMIHHSRNRNKSF